MSSATSFARPSLREGRRLCFVRAREDDGIVLAIYGRSSGFCVDPNHVDTAKDCMRFAVRD